MTERETEQKQTGYPSIDRPWRKYYNKQSINVTPTDCSMTEFLYQCNKNNLDSVALNYYGTEISFARLFENINQVVTALCYAGVKKGDVVSICGLNTPETIYLMYATDRLGAACNMLGLTSPVQDLHEQIASTDSRIIFTVEMAYSSILEAINDTKIEQVITLPVEYSMPIILKTVVGITKKRISGGYIRWSEFVANVSKEKLIYPEVSGDDLALIEYTGGSTGTPKGVMLSNKNMNSYYTNFIEANHSGLSVYERGDSYLCAIPVFLAVGASSCLHGPMCHGMTIVLSPDPSPEAVAKTIIKRKPKHIIAGNLMIDEFLKESTKKKRSIDIRSIMYGGDVPNKEWEHNVETQLQKIGIKTTVRNGYGMTETSAAILIAPVWKSDVLIPLGHVNAKIVDPDDCHIEFGFDTEGELCLSADTIMLGYFKNENETSEVIFEENGQRWIKTHDLATISKDGYIKITGRIKRIYCRLISGTYLRVYPMRIEEVLLQDDVVLKCAVLGVEDKEVAFKSIAFVVTKDGKDDTETRKRLQLLCAQNLPESHVPDEYIFLREFPYTRAGKVDYQKLAEMVEKAG